MEKSKYGVGEKVKVEFDGIVTAMEYLPSQNVIRYRVETEKGVMAFLTEKEMKNASNVTI